MPNPARRWILVCGIGALFAPLASRLRPAAARQLRMRESRPAAGAIIRGRRAEYVVYFDGPVDHASSRLHITQAGRLVQRLNPLLDSASDVLFASGETPPPGSYLLHWEARSMDGEIAAGDIPFDVAP